MISSKTSILSAFAEEEGLWAYKHLPVATKIFAGLDPAPNRHPQGISPNDIFLGRTLSDAAASALVNATLPMSAGGNFLSVDAEGHDANLVISLMGAVAKSADVLATAQTHETVGILPDEIDVAVAIAETSTLWVAQLDRLVLVFDGALQVVLTSEVIAEAQITSFAAAYEALLESITALNTLTQMRFDMTRQQQACDAQSRTPEGRRDRAAGPTHSTLLLT